LEIQCHARPVAGEEVVRAGHHHLAARAVDADHVRTQISQDRARVRPGSDAGEFDDLDAVEGSHGRDGTACTSPVGRALRHVPGKVKIPEALGYPRDFRVAPKCDRATLARVSWGSQPFCRLDPSRSRTGRCLADFSPDVEPFSGSGTPEAPGIPRNDDSFPSN